MGLWAKLLGGGPERRPDIDADSVWAKIDRSDAPLCRVSKGAALLIRQKLVDDLGRTLGTTPLPSQINGTEIVVDARLPGITVEVVA